MEAVERVRLMIRSHRQAAAERKALEEQAEADRRQDRDARIMRAVLRELTIAEQSFMAEFPCSLEFSRVGTIEEPENSVQVVFTVPGFRPVCFGLIRRGLEFGLERQYGEPLWYGTAMSGTRLPCASLAEALCLSEGDPPPPL